MEWLIRDKHGNMYYKKQNCREQRGGMIRGPEREKESERGGGEMGGSDQRARKKEGERERGEREMVESGS